ncbi:cell wall hydrolase [Marinobacterium sp. CAU 1594]|nr:cell wall hydrolase [Marinobacterium arenosum]
MDLFATLALCMTLTVPSQTLAASCDEAREQYRIRLKQLQLQPNDHEAIARVVVAEAAGEGDRGMASVLFTILNRLISGRFGDSIPEILNAPGQFEPVSKVGAWDYLPVVSQTQQSKIDAILALAVSGRISDPTNGSLYFQNPALVAKREDTGVVSIGLTHFGRVFIVLCQRKSQVHILIHPAREVDGQLG